MRKPFLITTAIAATAMGLVAPQIAHAHFVLESPRNWAEQDNLGGPQKSGPCGQDDPQTPAVPTNAVTAFQAGQIITVTINEAVYHRGHYRVVLSTSGRAGLPADPTTTVPGTCMALAIQDPPVFPVLADGVFPHQAPFDGPQSFQVTLPNVACANCTLQVLEFMSTEIGASPNCFYHHCADITIDPGETGTGGAGGSQTASDGGVTTDTGGTTGNSGADGGSPKGIHNSAGCSCDLGGGATPVGSALGWQAFLVLRVLRRRHRAGKPALAGDAPPID